MSVYVVHETTPTGSEIIPQAFANEYLAIEFVRSKWWNEMEGLGDANDQSVEEVWEEILREIRMKSNREDHIVKKVLNIGKDTIVEIYRIELPKTR